MIETGLVGASYFAKNTTNIGIADCGQKTVVYKWNVRISQIQPYSY